MARVAAAACAWLAAAPAAAQHLGQGTGTEVPVWRVLGALILCLGLAAAAAFVLRRRLRGPGPIAFGRARRLQLVERLRLSHQVDLCMISCDGGEFLIAATPHGAALIKDGLALPAPTEAPE